MKWRFLCGFSAAASLLLAICANAAATTKNIDIVVTHGAGSGTPITTMTIQNGDPSNPIVPGAPGYPYIAGQAFVRSNSDGTAWTGINSYPICEDASSSARLACQWDEIATRRENGDDGTWRHASLTVLLPPDSPQYTNVRGGRGLAACTSSPCPGIFKVGFKNTSGTYAPAVHGSIADVCNGHDIKLVMTDVRGQNDQLRGPAGQAGTLTFDTCRALSNTGRDAPRQFAQGAVRNGWLIQGPPLYGNGTADPLLYVKCYMNQTYTFSRALGPLEHACSVHNSWMNVAAGSTGNSGSQGPAGFAGDPQAITYRPVLYDGSTVILDWGTSYWDETVPDTALNVSTGVWTIPALAPSTNPKAWGRNNAFRYSDSAMPPQATQHATKPFQNGQLLYTCAAVYCGSDAAYDPTHALFSKYAAAGRENMPTYTAPGTGNSTFSWRVQHPHWSAWWTIDPSAVANWASASSAARYTSPLQPQLTDAERTYWKQTGAVPALQTQSPNNFLHFPGNGTQQNARYAPMDLVGISLGTGVGGRPDIGLQNEYVSEWWSAQTPNYWNFINALALVGMGAQGEGDLLNEETGRAPAINNGGGATYGHGGTGTPYPGLGALHPGVFIFGQQAITGVVAPLENIPYNDCVVGQACQSWATYPFSGLQDNTHQSAYAFGLYQFTGSEMHLAALEDAANRAIYYASGGGCQIILGGKNPTGGNQICTLPNGVTWYSFVAPGDQRRGSAWAIRDVAAAAAFGGDNFAGSERQFFSDVLNETYYFNVACGLPCGMIDPPTPTSGPPIGAQESGFATNAAWGSPNAVFIDGYITQASYMAWAMLHAPLARNYLSMQYRLYSMMCGDGVAGIANAPSSMFCATYYYMPAIRTLTPAVLNTTDGSDYGYDANLGNTSTFTAGSQVIQSDMQYFLLNQFFTTKIKFFNWTWPSTDASYSGTCDPLPDQITEGTWYYLVNNTATQKQFRISARPGGTPLGPFTKSGQLYTGHVCNAFVRWDASVAATAPTAGLFFLSPAYASYSLSSVTALVDINQSLGNIFPSASAILDNILARYAHNTQGWPLQPGPGDATANNWWDPNLAVR